MPTPSPTATPTPTPVPTVVFRTLDASADDLRSSFLSKLSIGSGSQVTLSTVRSVEMLETPAPKGTAYYGFLPVGTKDRLALMVDVITTAPGRVQGAAYIGTKGDASLGDARQLSFQNSTDYGRASASTALVTTLSYDDEPAPVTLLVSLAISPVRPQTSLPGTPTPTPVTGGEPATVTAAVSTRTLRRLALPDTDRTVYVADQSGRGTFDGAQAQTLQDVDGDGVASSGTSGEVQSSRNAVIVAGTRRAWRVISISPSGRTVTLAPLGQATLSGRVQSTMSSRSIADATVQVWPGPFETKTRSDGTFSLYVTATQPWKVLVKKDGYVPYSLYASNRGTASIALRENAETSFNIAMAEVRVPASGAITVARAGSFIGALGIAVGDERTGDFAIRMGERLDPEGLFKATWGQICACYEGQSGVIEAGRAGLPLEEVPIPPQGYVTGQFLDLRKNYTYISKGREGLEGKYVVFIVDSMSGGTITFSYMFR